MLAECGSGLVVDSRGRPEPSPSVQSFATVFIDEAGDPGIRDGLRHLGGAYEIFVVGALVVRSENEASTVQWVKDMREEVRARQRPSLHYRDLSPRHRAAVSASLATRPCRAFALISHKSNLRSYRNPRLGTSMGANRYYNFCCRLLLERITSWCAAVSMRQHREHRPLHLVFSERGGHDYFGLIGYLDILEAQAKAGTTFLDKRTIIPGMLPRASMSNVRHDASAGLQLADIVASSFYQAARIDAPNWDVDPAMRLLPVIAKGPDGNRANVGLTIWPLPHQGELPDGLRPIFQRFGY